MERLCIYSKDIMVVTGKSERQSRNILNDMKLFYKKEKHQLISIEECCKYLGLEVETVRNKLK